MPRRHRPPTDGHRGADLVVHYGDVTAVRGVELPVAAGRAADAARARPGAARPRRCAPSPGCEQPTSGEIRIGGAAGLFVVRNGINIPAEKRGLSMVFQSYAIWPHMTVFDNVAYGLRVRRKPAARDQREGRAAALDLVQMGEFARPQRLAALRRPAAARGAGARLRVLAVRAAVRRAAVEPRRQAARPTCASSCASCSTGSASPRSTSPTISRRRWRCPTASSSCATGGSSRSARRTEIYNLPRNAFVADFVGSANLIRGRHRPDLSDGTCRAGDGRPQHRLRHGLRPHGRTGAHRVGAHRPPAAAPDAAGRGRRTCGRCRSSTAVFQGDFTQVYVAWGNQKLVIRGAAMEPVEEGRWVWLAVEPRHVVVLEA